MDAESEPAAVHLEVALTRCFLCGGGNEIFLNTKLTKHAAERVKKLHGKVIDVKPCPTCGEWMKKGIILLTFDESKSDKDWDKQSVPNPYRTGGFFVVKEEALARLGLPEKIMEFAKRRRWLFVEHQAAARLGLFEAAKSE